ncbi:MAG: EF-hand domain-containing protein [Geminicoccaceae bacterium]
MKTHTKIAIATSVAVIGGLALVGTSMARGGFHKGHGPFGGGAAMMMQQFDVDQDGKLTRAEIDDGLRSRITSADRDGDGNLNLEEFQPLLVEVMQPRIVKGFQFLDTDGDAVITPDEIEQPLNRMVSHLDRNDDGDLSADELQKRRGGWGRGHHGHDDDHHKRGGEPELDDDAGDTENN